MVGQHIRILKDGRWIHAVDCGDETVLHLAEEATPPRVRRAYRPEFVAGSRTIEVVTHRERTFPAKEVVRRAYSRASDPALAAMFRDSEAFVEWCTTGRLTAQRNVAIEVPGIARVTPPPAPAKGKRGRPGRKQAPGKAKVAEAKRAAARAGRTKAAPKRAKARAARATTAAKRPGARKAPRRSTAKAGGRGARR